MLCAVRDGRLKSNGIVRTAALLCLFTLYGPRGFAAGQDPQDADPLKRLNQSVESLVRRVSPSVVQVAVSGYGPIESSGRDNADVVIGRQRSLGSGVIIDPDGYIVTNAHVVAGAQQVQVTLPSPASTDSPIRSLVSGRGRTLEAKIVGVAQEVDLAVLKVEATGLPALRLADYDALHQGEIVFAFGTPEGLRNSVTMGVVSAVARQPDVDSPMVYIQTDAPINPGNSGGALVNVAGELVGINTFILTESGGSQGLGFAVPSAIVDAAWPQLRKYGHLHRGEIGLELQSITPELAQALDLPRDFGVLISDIRPKSPAAAAGLRVQDVIVSLDGKPIDSFFAMFCQSYARAAGERFRLGVLRGSRAFSTEIVVGAPADRLDRLVDDLDPERNLIKRLNILGVSVDDKVSALLPDLRLPFGVVVLGRLQRSRAADAPIDAGDVIHAVNGMLVSTFQDLNAAISALAPRSPVALQIERGGRLMFVSFTLE
jgi:serine protease Do